ncbi:MAG: hypothetical protein ACK55I_44710, partial [bacterium]
QVQHLKQSASMLLHEFCLSTETTLWQNNLLIFQISLKNLPTGPRLKKAAIFFTPSALTNISCSYKAVFFSI